MSLNSFINNTPMSVSLKFGIMMIGNSLKFKCVHAFTNIHSHMNDMIENISFSALYFSNF